MSAKIDGKVATVMCATAASTDCNVLLLQEAEAEVENLTLRWEADTLKDHLANTMAQLGYLWDISG